LVSSPNFIFCHQGIKINGVQRQNFAAPYGLYIFFLIFNLLVSSPNFIFCHQGTKINGVQKQNFAAPYGLYIFFLIFNLLVSSCLCVFVANSFVYRIL